MCSFEINLGKHSQLVGREAQSCRVEIGNPVVEHSVQKQGWEIDYSPMCLCGDIVRVLVACFGDKPGEAVVVSRIIDATVYRCWARTKLRAPISRVLMP